MHRGQTGEQWVGRSRGNGSLAALGGVRVCCKHQPWGMACPHVLVRYSSTSCTLPAALCQLQQPHGLHVACNSTLAAGQADCLSYAWRICAAAYTQHRKPCSVSADKTISPWGVLACLAKGLDQAQQQLPQGRLLGLAHEGPRGPAHGCRQGIRGRRPGLSMKQSTSRKLVKLDVEKLCLPLISQAQLHLEGLPAPATCPRSPNVSPWRGNCWVVGLGPALAARDSSHDGIVQLWAPLCSGKTGGKCILGSSNCACYQQA